MSNRQERPICPRCQLQTEVVRVEPGHDHETWIYRCVGCGCEAAVALEPLA